MYYKNSSLIKHLDFFALDIISLFISFLSAYLFRVYSGDFVNNGAYQLIILVMVVPVAFYYIFFNPYKDILRRSHLIEIRLSINNVLASFLFTVLVLYGLQVGIRYSRLIIAYTYILYFFISTISRVIWKELILKGIINTGKSTVYNLLIICKKNEINELLYNIKNSDYGKYTLKGIYFADDTTIKCIDKISVIQNKNNLYDYVVDNNINEIFIATLLSKSENNIIRKLISDGIVIQMDVNPIFGIESEDRALSNVGMYNTLQLSSYSFTPSQKFYFIIKRFMDIVVSVFGCILTAIMYLIIKIIYLLSGDDYPIFYKQKRIGLNGTEFNIFKFRTMIPDADEVLKELLKDEKIKEEWEKNQKLDDDPRITKAGKFLRKTSLDELPQFINVLRGEMSIIGPRPLVPGELKSKNGIILYERVKPGITGWWACNGRSNMSYEERLEHEYYYVRNCSLYLDILCILRTFYVVLFGKGAK